MWPRYYNYNKGFLKVFLALEIKKYVLKELTFIKLILEKFNFLDLVKSDFIDLTKFVIIVRFLIFLLILPLLLISPALLDTFRFFSFSLA